MISSLLIIASIYLIGFVEILTFYIYFNPFWREDFRIHYLSECIEVELILPFEVSADALLMTALKKQIRVMKKRVRNISNIVLFFKQNED